MISENKKINSVFVEAARKTLMFLSVHKFSEKNPDFKALEIPEARPEIADIQDLFRSEAQYTRIKLFNDFKAEVVSVIKYVFSSEILISRLDAIFNKFPSETALQLKKFTGLMKSAKLRFRYLNLILDIENLPEDVPMRMEELRRKNAGTPNDELLMTYARTVDFSDSWNALKAEAKTRSTEVDNVIYKNFYERVLSAEARALKLGDISLFDKSSNIDNLIVIIQTGVLLKYAGPATFHSLGEFYNYVAAAWVH